MTASPGENAAIVGPLTYERCHLQRHRLSHQLGQGTARLDLRRDSTCDPEDFDVEGINRTLEAAAATNVQTWWPDEEDPHGTVPCVLQGQGNRVHGRIDSGEVPERTNGTVLKTVEGQPSAGSNPALSAETRKPAAASPRGSRGLSIPGVRGRDRAEAGSRSTPALPSMAVARPGSRLCRQRADSSP